MDLPDLSPSASWRGPWGPSFPTPSARSRLARIHLRTNAVCYAHTHVLFRWGMVTRYVGHHLPHRSVNARACLPPYPNYIASRVCMYVRVLHVCQRARARRCQHPKQHATKRRTHWIYSLHGGCGRCAVLFCRCCRHHLFGITVEEDLATGPHCVQGCGDLISKTKCGLENLCFGFETCFAP